MQKYFLDAISYKGNSWGHAAVSVAFEFSALAFVGALFWLVTA